MITAPPVLTHHSENPFAYKIFRFVGDVGHNNFSPSYRIPAQGELVDNDEVACFVKGWAHRRAIHLRGWVPDCTKVTTSPCVVRAARQGALWWKTVGVRSLAKPEQTTHHCHFSAVLLKHITSCTEPCQRPCQLQRIRASNRAKQPGGHDANFRVSAGGIAFLRAP